MKRTFYLNDSPPDGVQVAELTSAADYDSACEDKYGRVIQTTVDADDIRIINGEFWYDWNLFTARALEDCAMDSFETAHCAHIYHVCTILGIDMPVAHEDYEVNLRVYGEVMAQGFERFKQIAHTVEYFGGVQLYGTGIIVKGVTECGTKVFTYHSDNVFNNKNAVDALSHTGVERWIYAFIALHTAKPKTTANTTSDDSDAVDLNPREVAP